MNKEKVYNKLVRDNIPNIIIKDGKECLTRVLNNEEFKEELINKLLEETLEFVNHPSIEELADVALVVVYLTEIFGKDMVTEVFSKKNNERGEFKDRIFLEKVIERNSEENK